MKRTFTFLMSLFLAVGTMWADVNAELTSKYVSIGGDATELTAGTWYALYNHNRGCYVSEETSAFKMRKAAIAEGAEAKDVAGKLFKLIATETAGEYYLVSGNGLYFDFKEDNASTVSESPVAYKIATIGTNAGHFYIQHATNSYVADGQEDGNNFVCWEKNVPANAGGNNCYHFKPVRLADNYEEFEIVYNYTYGDEVKYTETKKVVVLDSQFPDYPACSVALPLGVTASKPEGKVTASETKEIALSVNMPFEYVESLDDYENLSKADEETGNWKWYHLIFRPDYGKVLYYGGTADPIDASKTVVDEANEDAYSWAFVGNPFDGFKVVNKLAGAEKGLQAGADGGYVGDAAEVFKLTTSTWAENGFFMQSTTGVKQDRFNFSGNKLNYWNNADMGSTFQVKLRQTEAQKLAVLVAEVEDLLDEYKWEHEEEPALGQYSTAGYEALETAFEDDNRTIESLKAAIEAFRATRNMPIFTIDGAGKDYMQGKSIFVDENGALKVKATDATDKSMLWIFDMAETEVGVTDKVVVRNAATGELFWGADFIKVTETDPVVEDDGIFLFYKNGTGDPVHAQNDNGDVESVVTYWSYEATSGSAWKFTFVGVSNPAAYDLSEVKEQFATQAAEFAALGDGEALSVLLAIKEQQWVPANTTVQALVAKINNNELVLKTEVQEAMGIMESFGELIMEYTYSYAPAVKEAQGLLDQLEEDSEDYTKLATALGYFAQVTSSDEIYMEVMPELEKVVNELCDIDTPYSIGEPAWVEATTTNFSGQVFPLLANADLTGSWDGESLDDWDVYSAKAFDFDNGIVTFRADAFEVEKQKEEYLRDADGNLMRDADGNLMKETITFIEKQDTAAYLKQTIYGMSAGQYRLTGKGYSQGAKNAKMFVGKMDYSEGYNNSKLVVVYEEALPEAAAFGEDLVIEFTLDEDTDDEYVIGYSCDFDALGASMVVGGFKFEMFGAVTSTLRKDFQKIYNGGDAYMGVVDFSNLKEMNPYSFFEAMHPAYEALFEEVAPLYYAMFEGNVLKTKVEKAIEDMKAMIAKFKAVADYLQSDTYNNATIDALDAIAGYMEESSVYAGLMEAYNAAMGVVYYEEEVDGETEVMAKYYATFKSVADIEKALEALANALEAAEAKIPTAITLDEEEAELSDDMPTIQLTATVEGSETADKSVFWVSENEDPDADVDVVTVDENGLVKAVSVGTAYVTAYSIHRSVYAECVITVSNFTTGIDGFEVKVETVIYDIHGRQVEKMEKGFYIVNGKKVFVK